MQDTSESESSPGLGLRALGTLLDALPVGISARDRSGRLRFANRAGAGHHLLAVRGNVAEADGRVLQVERLSVPIEGETCEVRLTYDITEHRQLEDDLFNSAYFDAMTGLPNRGLIAQSAATLTGSGADVTFALAFVDLDGFKHINDYYGHTVGDALLQKIAQRIATQLRPSDVLGRIRGDEFVLLLSPAPGREATSQRVEALLERLKEPFFVEGNEIFASASIGVSVYPGDGRSFDELCAKANTAVYSSKSRAKGKVLFFEDGLGKGSDERMKVEQRLRLAVRDQRLCCAYQPKVDFRSDRVVGVEALLRWRDEEGLIQPPGDFVNLAVELGLMDQITHLVLAETIGSLPLIDEAFGRDCSVSINVAAKQAEQPTFMRGLLDGIAATGAAERFVLELTEEAFVSGTRFQSDVLPLIHEAGARVSIDDFGTGYSSLSSLASIAADEIKIDRSFITDIHQNPRNQGIVRAIESLAEALDMSVLVEGVETREELDYLLAATRIRFAQGFYFARPMFLDGDLGAGTLSADLRQPAPPARVALSRVRAGRAG